MFNPAWSKKIFRLSLWNRIAGQLDGFTSSIPRIHRLDHSNALSVPLGRVLDGGNGPPAYSFHGDRGHLTAVTGDLNCIEGAGRPFHTFGANGRAGRRGLADHSRCI